MRIQKDPLPDDPQKRVTELLGDAKRLEACNPKHLKARRIMDAAANTYRIRIMADVTYTVGLDFECPEAAGDADTAEELFGERAVTLLGCDPENYAVNEGEEDISDPDVMVRSLAIDASSIPAVANHRETPEANNSALRAEGGDDGPVA